MVVLLVVVASTLLLRHTGSTTEDEAIVTGAAICGGEITVVGSLRVGTGGWTGRDVNLETGIGTTIHIWNNNTNCMLYID